MSNLDPESPEELEPSEPAESGNELQEAVERKLHNDETAAYYADLQVEGTELVNELVPECNYDAVRDNPLLKRIATTFGMTKLDGFDLLDPVYVLAWRGLTRPVALSLATGAQLPSNPGRYYCSCCQDHEVTQVQLGENPEANMKEVYPVRLPFGLRVIEILLCTECIETLGVEPS